MFVKNTTNKDIKLGSCEGYKFVLPVGVSWIWETAGLKLLEIYKNQGVNGNWGFQGETKVFIPSNPTTPPVIASTESEWKKGGKKLAQVERFQINGEQVPRKHLLKVATERGVSAEKMMQFLGNDEIDRQTIAEEINNLPVPDEIRYPKELSDEKSDDKQ